MKNLFISEKVFLNSVAGKLTKSNLKITLVFYPSLILLFLYFGSHFTAFHFFTSVILFFGGILIWTLLEYIFNRFIARIDKSFPVLTKFNYLVHGIHYNQPKNPQTLFMAPLPGLLMAVITYFFFYLFFKESSMIFTAGIITGYLSYACVHYAVHRSPGKLISHALWIHHLKHHHKYPDKAFGVSSRLWDFVFGTMPPKDEQRRKQFS
jgi:sterol desaturase/sphingolipid hydroxylase (fatty acid hydroxylase superfamily)